MHASRQKAIVRALLERHGRTFAEELGIDVARNTPSPLFRLLCAALLYSTRISARLATRAARALSEHGWNTPVKLAAVTWAERTRVLNQAGYARYDESTSRMLWETSTLLLEKYGGDLRRLRAAADWDRDREAELLQEFKGIGEVGASIFLREVQVAWDEVKPYADARALRGARALGLPASGAGLRKLVPEKDFARLVAALVRVQLERDSDAVREAARGGRHSNSMEPE